MPAAPDVLTELLLRGLIDSPLLVGDLPEGKALHLVGEDFALPPEEPAPLNFQQKLGHLVEDAFSFLLEASPRYEVIRRNLQLQANPQTTLGELDFLVRDHSNSGQLIHLEIAAKFYLAVPAAESPSGDLALPGPDPRDNYFKKIENLRNHQLRLASRHRKHLPEEIREESIETRQLVTGCLFDPIDTTVFTVPEFGSPDCRRGRWLTVDDLPRRFPPDTRFEIVPKSLWPVPLVLWEEIDLSLEPWFPPPSGHLDHCVMLRVSGESAPHFITPRGYPKNEPA